VKEKGESSMRNILVQHGALLIFNVIQLITLVMVCLNKAWNVLPALGFVLLINGIYCIGFLTTVKKSDHDNLQLNTGMSYGKESSVVKKK
jgi:hypothetical protein